ncbi:phage/plasmid replication protein, II/X family [Moraxella bovis]|uniref:Phage/plasmid replication protein, gene II/X family n=2 Tax=Moraxella bovis TaxID=476 RepID=A0A378PZ01_MORBO|nr:phage/plasmid replication protein, II/X family [Moraxella bovis]STY93709.1 phage/plasmid replication protein, gene II/X family [Moraxella bovis]STY93721.1 phage/plasmid replication protein, gene II/X family [Moraxella bovis]
MLMLDTGQIHIPFLEEYCRLKDGSKTVWELKLDISQIDPSLNIWAKNVVVKNGHTLSIDYFHVYDSIPTSHSGIGYKIMDTSNRSMPHIILNASLAKILQGHNVYGNTDMITGVFEMLGTFANFHPKLLKYLDFKNAYISKFDVTLPMQTPSLKTAERIREYLRNVSWGRFKNLSITNERLEYNTLYFGSVNSKVGGFKVYCKGIEVNNHVKELTAQAQKGDIKALRNLQVYTDDVINFANRSIRLEATIKKRMLTENNLPTNLWAFLVYQLQNKSIYEQLFKQKTETFMQALQDMRMPYDDDTKVYDLLLKRLSEPTKAGNISTTKARNAWNFYILLKTQGFYEVKKTSSERTFQRNVKNLCDAGFNRAMLQNLGGKSKETTIIRLLNIDLNARLPHSYTPPTTQFYDTFSHYLLNVA